MTRIEREDYVMTGMVVDSRSIRGSLRELGALGDLRVNLPFKRNPEHKGKGRIVYFETRVDSRLVEIMKQRNGYMCLIGVRGTPDYRGGFLNKILMYMEAVEIDPNIVYGEFDRMLNARK